MRYLSDFLSSNGDEICQNLNCSRNEFKILKYLLNSFLKGNVAHWVQDVLVSNFKKDDKDDYDYLKHLDEILNLIELGYLSYTKDFTKKSPKLAILNQEIELSATFLNFIEQGKIETNLPEISPYKDHLEYLKDQFLRIEFYQKRANYQSKNAKTKFTNLILEIENIIQKRLKISKIEIICEQIFKEHALSKLEEVVFLALLKEEYSAEFENLRDLNALINLISQDEIERIRNRVLFEEGSNLLSSLIVDYDEVFNAYGNLSRSFFITEETLKLIMHPQKKDKKLKLENLVKESEIFELIEPKSSLNDVILNKKTKEFLENILMQLDKKVVSRLSSWGIKTRKGVDAKAIFYGPPGTGKTMSAISLAKGLKKQVLSFDCSKILSKYVGESEQNVRKIFDSYKEICIKTKSEPLLLLNEADQFLSTRIDSSSSSDKMHNQMQNIFLEQIEKFEGVLVATTNFLNTIDPAFSRRFDYKIEFKKPNFNERLTIWRKILPENASFEDGFCVENLAKFELSGAQIVLVLKNTALKVAIKDDAIFTMQDFENEISKELKSGFGDDKRVGLIF